MCESAMRVHLKAYLEDAGREDSELLADYWHSWAGVDEVDEAVVDEDGLEGGEAASG